jgi:hypothetical protein
MHYVINNKGEKFPITAEAAETIPDIAKELARIAEGYEAHIEIDETTGQIFIIDEKELSPTFQVKRAVEVQYIYDKYNVNATENIKRIPNKYLSPSFKGHLYVYTYITPQEFQGSIIVLDEQGNYESSYDELEESFIPPVDGLDAKAVEVCQNAFNIMTERYKNAIREAVAQGAIK